MTKEKGQCDFFPAELEIFLTALYTGFYKGEAYADNIRTY
jgi:hypothetical protein